MWLRTLSADDTDDMATTLRSHHSLAGILLLAAAGLVAPAAAQTETFKVTVDASVAGAAFWVDNVEYNSRVVFEWQKGSKHTLDVRSLFQKLNGEDSRLAFQTWQSVGPVALMEPGSPVQIVTADASTPSYTAMFQLERKVTVVVEGTQMLNLFDPTRLDYRVLTGAELPQVANMWGFVGSQGKNGCAGGAGIPVSTWFWHPDGSTLNLYAIPYPGAVFQGWTTAFGAMASNNALLVDRPLTLQASFRPARRIRLDSAPVKGLTVLVDGQKQRTRGEKCVADFSNYYTPDPNVPPVVPPFEGFPSYPLAPELYCKQILLCDGSMDLVPGSTHVFGAPVVQKDAEGKSWVFDHWDFGGPTGGQNTPVRVPDESAYPVYTAYFVPAVRASFGTVPGGFKLKIDGRDDWVSYNFDWGLGHKHTVSAPLEQKDASGRRYRFAGWSNGGEATQEITVAGSKEDPQSFRLVAKYEILGQVTLLGNEAQVSFTVNDHECPAPCTIDKVEGSRADISVPGEILVDDGTKAVFEAWSDGVETTQRTIEFKAESQSFMARYKVFYKLTLLSDPEGGAEWTLDPAPEAGGWVRAGTAVSASVKARRGFKFRRFDGGISGSASSGWVTMNAPATVVAHFDRIPALQESAVRNAAGQTPVDGVAPGSLVSILGMNLAGDFVKGPDSPLAMTIEGIAVQVDDRILPLVSISPAEVVALVYSDLPPGEYPLTFHSPGQPALTGTLKLVRNAPGLFRQPGAPEETPLAFALHDDGALVTPDNPAKVGETVTLLGTGFGPVDPAPLDGFAVPASPAMPLVDPLELTVDGEVRPHLWAGAAPGRVGYQSVRFKVDATMGQGQNLALTIKVNGQPSNTVLLPVQ